MSQFEQNSIHHLCFAQFSIDFVSFLVQRGSNKIDDDPPPIFSITTMSAASSSSRMGDHSNEFVDISIEEQPPPHYDDVIVVKPAKLSNTMQ